MTKLFIKKRRKTSHVAKADKSVTFDYKDVRSLGRYLTENGSISSRANTGLSQKQQRALSIAIKRARHLALMPFTQTLR